MVLVSLTTTKAARMSARFVVCLCATTAALSPIHEALRSRRTVHNFDNSRDVPDEVLHRAIEAATYAPNHKMTEPWLFRRLGTDAIEAIASLNAASIADPDKAAKKKKRWAEIRNWLVVTSRITPGDELLTREDYAATCCIARSKPRRTRRTTR